MKIITQYVWVPNDAHSNPGTLAGVNIGEDIERLRPDGARLVNIAPAGSSFSPGTFLVVWEQS